MLHGIQHRWRELGEYVRDQRRLGQLSLRRLSELSGISNPYLSQIERGLRRPSAGILQQLALVVRTSRLRRCTCGPACSMTSAAARPATSSRRSGGRPELERGPEAGTLIHVFVSFRAERAARTEPALRPPDRPSRSERSRTAEAPGGHCPSRHCPSRHCPSRHFPSRHCPSRHFPSRHCPARGARPRPHRGAGAGRGDGHARRPRHRRGGGIPVGARRLSRRCARWPSSRCTPRRWPSPARRQRRDERLRARAGGRWPRPAWPATSTCGRGPMTCPSRRRRARLPVVHVPAGPADLPKEHLPDVVDEFTDGVLDHLGQRGRRRHPRQLLAVGRGRPRAQARARPAAGVDVPHAGPGQGRDRRRRAGTSAGRRRGRGHRLLATPSWPTRRPRPTQLERLYGAGPTAVEIVPPGVDHAFFSPGDRGSGAAGRRSGLGDEPGAAVRRPHPAAQGRRRRRRGTLAALDRDRGATLRGRRRAERRRGRRRARPRARAGRRPAACSDRVRFVPPQPHHLLSTYYRAADVCLVPSRSESFGLVALEAAACGTPVVAAAVGGLLTLVDDGRTGFLVDGRDPARLRRRRRQAPRRPGPGRGAWARPAAAEARGLHAGRPRPPACAASTPTSTVRAAGASATLMTGPGARHATTESAIDARGAASTDWLDQPARRQPGGRGRRPGRAGRAPLVRPPRRRGEGLHHRLVHPRPAHARSTRRT